MRKIFIILAMLASVAFASELEVKGAFIKQTPPNAKNTAIFLTIVNNSDKNIALLGANSDFAKQVELHTHTMKNGKMEMLQVKDILIKAHSTVALKPGGLHIMLFDIKGPVVDTTKVNLKLNFDNKTSLEVKDIPSKKL